MRICLIGTFSRKVRDEGHTNVSIAIATELKKKHQILSVDGYQALHAGFWKSIKNFDPQIIHFVPGASIWGFALLKLLKLHTRAKTVMSLINPQLSPLAWKLIPLLKPDLILNQSYETEKLCYKLGIQTEFLPNGVDIEKFFPVQNERKPLLREKYGTDKGKFVILHVGHLTKGREVSALSQISSQDNQVLIIASSYFKTDQKILDTLRKRDCLVWQGYFENIWEIYQLADCYVYPTPQDKSTLIPLSILEAMSCNLPVVSRKLDGLTRVFNSGQIEGLILRDKDKIQKSVEEAKDYKNVNTREAILQLSWVNIATKLEEIHRRLL